MRATPVLVAALCAAVASSPKVAAQSEQQGFFRVVEGDATLIRVEDGQSEAAQENTPALAGDRVVLSAGSRVEVILPDGHRLRLDRAADLELTALARSLDQDQGAAALHLVNGALAIDVPGDLADRTVIETEAARVWLERGGLYLVEIDARGATRVVVREGTAEVVTADETTVVERDEEAVVELDRRSRVALYQAPPLTEVERWAEQLEAEAASTNLEPVEPELRYAAAPLERYGSWVDNGGRRAWRPRVESGWRPYNNGYWTSSPAGLVWSSYEPWGWVPYHYGQWDLDPSYGWMWYPGAVYAPAHVVWYWGPSYAAWIPSGYYTNYYARRFGFHVGFDFGFFGVSHADWRGYRDWTFCSTRSIGYHNQYRYHRDHHAFEHHRDFDGHGRGFITADTRGLDRGRWRDPAAVEGEFTRRAHRRSGGGSSEFADLSNVIARSPEVDGSQLRELERQGGGDGDGRVASHRPRGPGDGAIDAEQQQPIDRAGLRGGRVDGRRTAGVSGADGEDAADVGRPAPGRRPADNGRAADGGAAESGVPEDGRRVAVSRDRRERVEDVEGRDGVRAFRSSGLETPAEGVADRGRGDVVDRERAVGRRPAAAPTVDIERQQPVTRVAPRRETTADGETGSARVRRAYPETVPGGGAAAPANRSLAQVDRAPRTDAARPRGERSAPAAGDEGTRARIERAPQVDRAAPLVGGARQPYDVRPRVERAPQVDRVAPQVGGARQSYEVRPRVERSAPVPRDQGARVERAPQVSGAAPQVDRAPRSLEVRSRVERPAPAPRVDQGARARVERAPQVVRAAPPVDRAPGSHEVRSHVERSAPAPRASAPIERSAPPHERAAPAARSEARSEPRSEPRAQSAPSQSSGGGGRAHGRAEGGGGGGHARGGRSH